MEYGTDPKFLARTNDPQTSHDAASAVNSIKLEKLVYETIKKSGDSGVIAAEILAAHPNLPYSSITARFKALSSKGFIRFDGERTGPSGRNQRVMFANTNLGVFP